MRAAATGIGMLLGVSVAVGVALSQAETKIDEGRPVLVVASVTKGRIHETPIVKRCLWVGVPAGLVGAGIGYYLTAGANLGGAFLGALILSGMASGWRENWPTKYGQAGENAKVSDSLLNGLVGGLFGAAATAYLRKHHQSLPARLAPPQSADA